MDDPAGSQKEQRLSTEAASDIGIVAKGGAVQIAGQVTQRSLLFFFTVAAVAVLGPAVYGMYRGVAQVMTIAGQLGLAGFNYAAMRWISRALVAGNPAGVRGAARVGVTGAVVASGVVVIALLVGADLLAEPFAGPNEDPSELARLYRIAAPYVPLFALMQVLRYCTQGYKTMVPSVVAGNIVQPAARFVIGLGVLIAGFTVAGLLVTLFVSAGIGAVVAGWWFRRMMTAEERATVPVAETGPMIRFALPQAGASLLGIQTLGLGIIVLDALSTNRSVGLFAVALSLQGPGTVFLGGIVNIWAPVVSDLHESGNIERLGSLYQTINRWIATFSFPVFAALILMPDFFLEVFFPRSTDAGAVVAILAVGNLFYTGTGPTGYLLSMTGRPGINFVNSAVAVGLFIALGAWLVPAHGVVGMAVVDAVVTALVNSARVIEAKILVGVQPFGRTFFKPVVATLAGALVLLAERALPVDGVVFEGIAMALGAVVYLAVLTALGSDPEERHVLERIKARAFRRGSKMGGDHEE